MVIAIIGVIAALALPSLAGVLEAGRHTKTNRQAQNIAHTYAAALAAGATFIVRSREGVVDLLTQPGGVPGTGIFSGMSFAVPMDIKEINEVRVSPALIGQFLPDGSFQLEFQPQGRP